MISPSRSTDHPDNPNNPNNPGLAPQDPRSDPEHKLGATPPPDVLAKETELQRTGAAAQSSVLNANTPRPSQGEKNTVRDWDEELRTP